MQIYRSTWSISSRKLKALAAAAACIPVGSWAHEFDSLEIASFSRSSDRYLEILLQDTVAGRRIICAAYNDSGELIASDTQITDNLATSVLIRYSGNDAATARCVFND